MDEEACDAHPMSCAGLVLQVLTGRTSVARLLCLRFLCFPLRFSVFDVSLHNCPVERKLHFAANKRNAVNHKKAIFQKKKAFDEPSQITVELVRKTSGDHSYVLKGFCVQSIRFIGCPATHIVGRYPHLWWFILELLPTALHESVSHATTAHDDVHVSCGNDQTLSRSIQALCPSYKK